MNRIWLTMVSIPCIWTCNVIGGLWPTLWLSQGSAPTISVDNTAGCQLYLSKESLRASITTAKSSEINVLIPGAEPDGDWVRYLVSFLCCECGCCDLNFCLDILLLAHFFFLNKCYLLHTILYIWAMPIFINTIDYL